MTFKSEIHHDYLLLTLEGNLIGEDMGSGILEVANDAISEQVKNCIINIKGVKYINSTGIGVLITLLTKFRNNDGEVVIMHPSEHVQKLLIITKLTAIFKIADGIEEAIDYLQQS